MLSLNQSFLIPIMQHIVTGLPTCQLLHQYRQRLSNPAAWPQRSVQQLPKRVALSEPNLQMAHELSCYSGVNIYISLRRSGRLVLCVYSVWRSKCLSLCTADCTLQTCHKETEPLTQILTLTSNTSPNPKL